MLGEEKLKNSAVQNGNYNNKKKHCMAVIGFFFVVNFSPLAYFLLNKIASE